MSAALYSLDADVIYRAQWMLAWLAYLGIPARVTEGHRTPERQAELYAQGRTAPGPIVTETLQSSHLTRRAFDIDFIGYAADDVPRLWWDWAGYLGEMAGLTWGGRWGWDFRHFEA